MLITLLCSGNVQRSPTLEAVLNSSVNDLKCTASYERFRDYSIRVVKTKRGKKLYSDLLYEGWSSGNAPDPMNICDREVNIMSAGTNVERALNNQEPPLRMIKVFGAALKLGLVPEEVKSEIQKYVEHQKETYDDRDIARMSVLHGIVRPLLRAQNITWRNKALEEVGVKIRYFPKKMRQFLYDKDQLVILAVDDKVLALAQETYNRVPKEQQPEIVNYGSIVGSPVPEESMSGGLEGARRHATYFMDTRIKGITYLNKVLDKAIDRKLE